MATEIDENYINNNDNICGCDHRGVTAWVLGWMRDRRDDPALAGAMAIVRSDLDVNRAAAELFNWFIGQVKHIPWPSEPFGYLSRDLLTFAVEGFDDGIDYLLLVRALRRSEV